MREKVITSKGIQDRVKSLAIKFVEYVHSNQEYYDKNTELILILNKINSNIQTANLLSSYAMFNESRIILRSAFETVVLFEFLSIFPDEMVRYKTDSKISEFQNLVGFYKRGYLKYQNLIEVYDFFSEELQSMIPFRQISENKIITYDVSVLEKFLHNKFKPLSQKVDYMLKKLIDNGALNASLLNDFRITLYNIPSQVSHSMFETLIQPVKVLTDDEIKKEIQSCFRESMCILCVVLNRLEHEQNYNSPIEIHKKIGEIMTYLDFDIVKEQNKQNKQISNLIEIVKQIP